MHDGMTTELTACCTLLDRRHLGISAHSAQVSVCQRQQGWRQYSAQGADCKVMSQDRPDWPTASEHSSTMCMTPEQTLLCRAVLAFRSRPDTRARDCTVSTGLLNAHGQPVCSKGSFELSLQLSGQITDRLGWPDPEGNDLGT